MQRRMVVLKGIFLLQRRYVVASICAGLLLFVFSSCQFTQSSFSRTVSNAGAVFSAATLTLDYVHSGKITNAYARSTFMNYQNELQGLDQQLASLNDAPNPRIVRELVASYKPAMAVVNQPCLDTSCEWHAQLNTLSRASQAFLKAGE